MKDYADPEQNDLIPVGDESERGAVSIPWIEDQLEHATVGPKPVQVAPGLYVAPCAGGRPGAFVQNEERSIGDLSQLPFDQVKALRDFFRGHPFGNELIPGE